MASLKSFALAVVLCGAVGCAAKPPLPSVSVTPSPVSVGPSLAEEEDKFAAALLEDPAHHQPASKWLEDIRDHILWGKGDRDSLRIHFAEMYKAGVAEIWACTQTFKDKQVAFCYIVHLPDSGAARAAAFDIHNRFWMSQTDDNSKLEVLRRGDVGQKYLIYNFD